MPRARGAEDWLTMIVAQRYELGEPLGAGGEARVYRARDTVLEQDVAVRLEGALPSGIEMTRPRLETNPNWVRLLEAGNDQEHGLYTVFELLKGETLGALVGQRPLDARDALLFTMQSLDAVGAVHAAGFIHGDLNADNFLLNKSETWKLLELPFHRITIAKNRSALFGSIYTLSPEQIDGKAPDARSELFSLGCLFYYAASGQYPHAGGSAADIAIGRLRFPATPLCELAPHYPHEWTNGVMRLLARDPAERPQNVSAARQLLLDDLNKPRHTIP